MKNSKIICQWKFFLNTNKEQAAHKILNQALSLLNLSSTSPKLERYWKDASWCATLETSPYFESNKAAYFDLAQQLGQIAYCFESTGPITDPTFEAEFSTSGPFRMSGISAIFLTLLGANPNELTS